MHGQYIRNIFAYVVVILFLIYNVVQCTRVIANRMSLQSILQNKYLEEFGYIVYTNGKIAASNNKRVHGLWAGGDVHDMDPLFKKFSKKSPSVYYILCRIDGLAFRETETVNTKRGTFKTNVIFDLFDERVSRYDRSKFKIIFCSINYKSFNHLQNTHTFSNLLLLPTPYTQGYHQYPTEIHSYASWYSKKDKAIWVGSMNGVHDVCRSKVGHDCPRLHIYHATRDNHRIDFMFKNDSQFNDDKIHKHNVDHTCVTRNDISKEEQKQYKMIIVIDGWGWSGGLSWVLHSGCLPIVISDFHVGITKNHLKPWVHYIPAKTDGSDINEHVQWVLQNPTRCMAILENLHKKLKRIDVPMFLQEELQREMID